MSFKDYVTYFKDNPEGYWFKRKLYGWGWVPVTWQGWLVIVALIVVIVVAANLFLVREKVFEYFVTLCIAVAAVIAIGYWKGEPPKWQWGLPKEDSAKQDEIR